MNTRHSIAAVVALAMFAATPTAATKKFDLPPLSACAAGTVPVATDFGGLGGPSLGLAPDVVAALSGATAVGTDCSLFLLPPGI